MLQRSRSKTNGHHNSHLRTSSFLTILKTMNEASGKRQKMVQYRAPDEHHALLKVLMRKKALSKSAVIRLAVQEYGDRELTPKKQIGQ
jgi:hypothetical protein